MDTGGADTGGADTGSVDTGGADTGLAPRDQTHNQSQQPKRKIGARSLLCKYVLNNLKINYISRHPQVEKEELVSVIFLVLF